MKPDHQQERLQYPL